MKSIVKIKLGGKTMSYKVYTDKLGRVLKACKVKNINANMKRLQDDIVRGINTEDIIENLHSYV